VAISGVCPELSQPNNIPIGGSLSKVMDCSPFNPSGIMLLVAKIPLDVHIKNSGGVQVAIFEKTVEIKCPVDLVFTYAADAKSWLK
jgi:hypothetical protein